MATLMAMQISLPNRVLLVTSFPSRTKNTNFPSIKTLKLHVLIKPRRLFSAAGAVVSKPDSAAVVSPSDDGELARRWREMVGESNWDGLLNPMDEVLRRELIKYGEMAGGTYTAFVGDTYARDYGVCRFQVWQFFDGNHPLMPQPGYDVTKLIYATTKNKWWPPFMARPANPRTWEEDNIFMGYVAVSNDERTRKLGRRDVCVAWRGTSTTLEWGSDFQDFPAPMPPHEEYLPEPDPDVMMETGFLSLYTHKDEGFASARELVLSELRRLINKVYPDEEMSITTIGHSLGAALALINGYDIMKTKTHVRQNGEPIKVCTITYAGPRVGNIKFKDDVEKVGLKVLRVVNVRDPVPKVPGTIVNETWPQWMLRVLQWFKFPWNYSHVGVALELDNEDSTFLKKHVLVEAHDLEGYIHLIDGYPTKGENFKLATERDIALVNRNSDYLLKDYGIPPVWEVPYNMNMVQNKDGKWCHKSSLEDFE